ncbi:MAG: hypothetical protein ACLFR7_06150 [Opitutales bacterium]
MALPQGLTREQYRDELLARIEENRALWPAAEALVANQFSSPANWGRWSLRGIRFALRARRFYRTVRTARRLAFRLPRLRHRRRSLSSSRA